MAGGHECPCPGSQVRDDKTTEEGGREGNHLQEKIEYSQNKPKYLLYAFYKGNRVNQQLKNLKGTGTATVSNHSVFF